MAYKNIIIQPANYSEQQKKQNSQFYRGFSSQDPTTANVTLYDFDLVKQDILNHFNTRQGERLMNPGFGSIIWDTLFEPFTAEIKKSIEGDVNRILSSDPRVSVESVELSEAEYGLVLEATLKFVPTSQVDNMKLTFNRNLGLTVQ
jgi:phage baseplate assembly protein W